VSHYNVALCLSKKKQHTKDLYIIITNNTIVQAAARQNDPDYDFQ